MDQNYCHKKLEESRKKLTDISKQIDFVDKEDVQWCCIDQVASSIGELQTLISWIAQEKGGIEDNTVVLQKLQQLSKIRQALEKTAVESQQHQSHFKKNFSSVPNLNYSSNENIPDVKKTVSATVSCPGMLPEDPFRTLNNYYINNINSGKLNPPGYPYDKNFDADNMDLYLKKLCSTVPSTPQAVKVLGKEIYDPHDSLGTAISEDEGLGEESRRGDLTGPCSLLEMNDSAIDLNTGDSNPALSATYKGNVSPTIKHRDQTKFRESWCHRNSIELCLATITKLKESLQMKEHEIAELKKASKPIAESAELQIAVKNLQRNITELHSNVLILEKENSTLKESLLELEEAENDARLKGQRLEEKLVFLQEKDSHFQAEFAETKHALKLCLDELSLKDAGEREMHSQLKYMEVLVQKYEEQLKNVESKGQKFHKETHVKEKSNLKKFSENTQNISTQTHVESTLEIKSCQTDPYKSVSNQQLNESGVQTDAFDNISSAEELQSLIRLGIGLAAGNYEGNKMPSGSEFGTSFVERKELLEGIHHLVSEDADLQEQLKHADEINLSLWQKLHSLQFHIGECENGNSQQKHTPENDTVITPSTAEVFSNSCSIDEKKHTSFGILTSFDCSEEKIKERLYHLEEINSSFSKKLEMREKLYLEQERRHEEWLKMEDQLTGELKSLGAERDSLLAQVTQLEVEKVQLSTKVKALENELSLAREKHQQEATKITAERDEIKANLQKTIDDLVVREKDYLKQIAKLKSTRNKQEEKLEFDALKSSYVQLQIELVGYRDQMQSVMSEFNDQLDNLNDTHSIEENRLLDELGVCRGKDIDCENKLHASHTRQLALEKDVRCREEDLEKARNEFKSHMQKAEEEHRAVEIELKKKLTQMEEGTAFATKALTEEKVRLEKELQENIDDLRSKEELYKARILELESNVSQLHQELHQLTGNVHTKFDTNENVSFQRERLLSEIQELRLREGELRDKLDEMEKKENAYRETLEHADRIVASVERGYKNKIEELEMSERCLKQRVGYLEEVENRLRTALQKERRSCDGRRPDELIVELSEAEKREHSLKDEVNALEASNRSAGNRVRELEKVQQRLEEQLNDHEDLATSFEKLHVDQDIIKKEVMKLRKAEGSLQLALHQAEGLLQERETQISTELQRFSNEKHELEETISQLRSQVRDMKEKMEKRLVDHEPGEPISILEFPETRTPDIKSLNKNIASDTIHKQAASSAASNTSNVFGGATNNKTTQGSLRTDTLTGAKIEDMASDKTNVSQRTLCATGATRAEKEYSEVRLQLEECMTRAMDAMKMEMEHKEVEFPPSQGKSGKGEFLPPYNFRVVQQVGSDTLLVGWEYTEIPNLEGYELYVNDQLHETVYASDRRKAVISGLDLSKHLSLSICAVSTTGQVSKPQTLDLPQNANQGFFFQDDDDEDDDELFDDDVVDKNLRPYSVEW